MHLPKSTINRLQQRYGKWALITGATSGIGREMAQQLGEAGFKLVITGRRTEELQKLATELFDQHRTEAIPIPGDLSKEADVKTLQRETAHLPIGVAVLNAGFATSGLFADSPLDSELNMLDLNCRALLMLTHHFAQQLKSNQRKGAIVLLSSMVAFQGVPNAAHYAATKAYVQTLGEGLSTELKPAGIDVLCAAPGPVETGFSKRANMKMGQAMKAKDVASSIIQAIGKQRTVFPGFLTKFLVYNLRLTPRWLKIRIMGKVMAGFTKHQQAH